MMSDKSLCSAQKDALKALQQLDDIEAAMGGRNGPSVRLRAFIESLLLGDNPRDELERNHGHQSRKATN